MSTVEIRAGSQFCKGQPQAPAWHLSTNLSYPRNFVFYTRVTYSGQAGRDLGMGRKGRFMFSPKKKSHKHWVEWFPVLVLFGVLAGAVGGLAVGVITAHTSSSTTGTAQ